MQARCAAPRKPSRWILAGALSVVVAFGALAPAALAEPSAQLAPSGVVPVTSPAPDFEAKFVSSINALRASKGLSQLQVASQLQGVARNWTEQMVLAGQISHNPNLGTEVSGAWTKVGENVGVGYDVEGLMQAFINSPAHYRNLVDPDWTYLGVGVTLASDGRTYTTHNFMNLASAPLPVPVPVPAPPAPTPQPTPTTAPPTTAAPTAAPPSATPPSEIPHPTPERVAAVLTPLRSLEGG